MDSDIKIPKKVSSKVSSGPMPSLIAQAAVISSVSILPDAILAERRSPKISLSFRRFSKNQLLIAAAVLTVVLSGTGVAVAKTQHTKKVTTPPAASAPVVIAPTPTPVPKPTTEASRLTGLPVDIASGVNNRPVTAVMIENSPEARPQSGLLQAGIIYEAIAEGGITRFAALFQDQKADRIGPVRSVRPYYLDWITAYDAAIGHVGGSQDGLAQIRSQGLKDLDQFANGGSYERITQRYAPHNVYTSSDKLDALETAKGFTKSTFTSFLRKVEAPTMAPTAGSIDLKISGYYYDVHYDYVKSSNSYLRSEGSKPHVDEVSGTQLRPKVVVAMVVPNRAIKSSDGWRMSYDNVGSGQMVVFQDGTRVEGTWRKTSRQAPLELLGTDGSPVAINSGQTWLTALDSLAEVLSK